MSARGTPASLDRAYVDTNVIVALFAGEGHPLHDQALDLFRRVADGQLRLILTPIVVAELAYVAESLFSWTRRETAGHLGHLVEAEGIEAPEAATLRRALDLYGRRRRLDFADAYLAAIALEVGPARVASLDADLDRIDGLVRVTA